MLRQTDGGVRPYVIFCGPPHWERSFAPPDGRGRPSLRDFWWSSTVERSFAPLDGRGVRPYVIRKLVAFIFFSIDKYKFST